MAFEPDYRTYDEGFGEGLDYKEKEYKAKIRRLNRQIKTLKEEIENLKDQLKAKKK